MKFLQTFFVFAIIEYTRAYLVGIDLGSEFFKATVMRPGKPFKMLENLQSKTKTPTGVYLKDDERLFGPDILIKKGRFPKHVLNFIDRFLGEKYDTQTVQAIIDRHFVSYDIERDEDRDTYNFKLKFNNEDYLISPEEVYGMLFRYIKFLSDTYANGRITDAVVAVPSSFGYKKRHAISQAVKLSGLTLKGIVTQNTAAAVHFMTDKSYNETSYYIIYNMGASYTQASLVSFYSNYTVNPKTNKTLERREVTVLGETWDDNLGGRDFDFNLVRHFMDLHDNSPQKKGKPSCKSAKTAEKLIQHAIRYKEMLSANKIVGINILGIESGMNLESTVTRETFEKINEEEFSRVYEPIRKLFELVPEVKPENITFVELIGGGLRIPKIQEVLKNQIGEEKIGTHMNGDDSIAFGAAYMAANFSAQFKTTKKVYVNNGAPFEFRINITEYNPSNLDVCENDVIWQAKEKDENEDGENTEPSVTRTCVRKLNKNATLYKIRHGFDLARTVSFKHDSDLQVVVYERMEGSLDTSELVTFKITGFDKVMEQMRKDKVGDALPKTNLRFKLSDEGLISLTADCVYESTQYLHWIKATEEGQKDRFEYLSNYTDPLSQEIIEEESLKLNTESSGNSTNSTNSTEHSRIKNLKKVGKSKKTEIKLDLEVERIYTNPQPLNKTNFASSKKKLDGIDKIEETRIKTAEQRNQLETEIYAKKEWLETEKAKLYSKPDELEKMSDSLKQVADWYDEDGWNANYTELQKKHSDMRISLASVEVRIRKHESRVKAFDRMILELSRVRNESEDLVSRRPWISDYFNVNFTQEIQNISRWFDEKREQQDKLPLHEDPIVSAELVDIKIKSLKREFGKMKMIQKPKNQTLGSNTTYTEEVPKFDKETLEELLEKMKREGNSQFSNEEMEKILKNYNATKTEGEENTNEEASNEEQASEQSGSETETEDNKSSDEPNEDLNGDNKDQEGVNKNEL